MKAKYEGGVFGHTKTMEGTLAFDDTNERLVFRNDKQKDAFFIPYAAVASAFADTQKRRPGAALWASIFPTLVFRLGSSRRSPLPDYSIQRSRHYVSGITSFAWRIRIWWTRRYMLSRTIRLTARGEIYVRKTGSTRLKDTTMP